MSEFQPVFLIGAARSGTKLLRDVIAQHSQVDKVPYDVNYIWRIGNQDLPHDEIPDKQISHEIRGRIKKNIERFHKGAPVLIEKTVSNCLRIPYLNAIYPQAKYIHLVRHGEDVVESVYRQWNAPPDWQYIFKKARTYPLLETPGYAWRYVKGIFKRSPNKHSSSTVWGPVYSGIQHDLLNFDLLQVCAIQWATSISSAFTGFLQIQPDKVYYLKYEDFVRSPGKFLDEIATFLSVNKIFYRQNNVLSEITIENIGKAKTRLTESQRESIRPYITPQLERLKYAIYD